MELVEVLVITRFLTLGCAETNNTCIESTKFTVTGQKTQEAVRTHPFLKLFWLHFGDTNNIKYKNVKAHGLART